MDPLAYPRPESWLPSDLAATCGIRRENAHGRSYMPSGPIDIWNACQSHDHVESSMDEIQTQLGSLHLDLSTSSNSLLPFSNSRVEPQNSWSKTPDTRLSRPQEWVSEDHATMTSPAQPDSSSPGDFPDHDSVSLPETPSACASPTCTLMIERIDSHVTEEDVQQHFMSPPEWPINHPFRRAYSHLPENMRNALPVRPEPFHVQSVRLARSGSTLQAEVQFTSPQDCERALIEMQHTVLIPHKSPWLSVRVLLTTVATSDRRGRLNRIQRSATTPSESARRSTPRRRTSEQPPNTHSSPSSPPCVPTTLTFVQGEEVETQSGAPMLASALAVAHASSALDPSNKTVFVGSLFSMASEATLYSLFAPYGPIHSVNIPRGQDCGFVQFARKEDAARAISEMQNCPIAGGTLRLSWGRSVGEKAAARAATRAGLRWVEDIA